MKKLITSAFSILASISLFAQSYPTTSLIDYWDFTSNYSSNINNISLTPLDLTTGEFVTDRNNIASNAFRVNGYQRLNLDAETHNDFRPTSGNITISLWIKPNIADCGYYPILAKQGNVTNTFNAFALGLVNNKNDQSKSEIYAQIGINGTIHKVLKNIDLTSIDNKWTHVVLTFDGSEIKLYINNSLADSKMQSGAIDFSQSNVDQEFGRDYNGYFDDLAIYNRALSASEMTHLYTGLAPSTNINSQKSNVNIAIFPNPAKDILNITSDVNIKEVSIINSIGQISKFEIINNSINISILPKGIYTVKIKDESDNLYINKVIKE